MNYQFINDFQINRIIYYLDKLDVKKRYVIDYCFLVFFLWIIQIRISRYLFKTCILDFYYRYIELEYLGYSLEICIFMKYFR